MSGVSVRKLDGSTASIGSDSVEALRSALRGEILFPGAPGYDDARTIWNAMIDKRPALVVRCLGPSDVVRAVRFAGAHELLVAVRAGGHNIAGNAICNEGLLIDVSQMRSIRVDRATKRAWVEPGATLADFDRETQMFALTTPVGINSTTGIAGLTLGGGFGWTTRKFGLSIDNLISVDVVTAAGEMLKASENENADLFWALRGGGGNFGVVTGFEFGLHDLGPEVLSGLIIHPFADASKLLPQYHAFAARAPEELTTWVVLRKAPPLPFLPAEWHGNEVFILAACYAGDMADGEKAMAPLRKLGSPIVDVIGPHPFVGWQAAFDPLLTPGARNYWKSHDFKELSEAACATIVDFAGQLPTPECEIFIAALGGRMGKVAADATAYGGRGANYVLNVHTRWRDSSDDDRCVAWARAFFDQTAPFSMGSAYVNFLTEEEGERLADVYGANFARLARVKAKYDPKNLFRVNQNIPPIQRTTAAA